MCHPPAEPTISVGGPDIRHAKFKTHTTEIPERATRVGTRSWPEFNFDKGTKY